MKEINFYDFIVLNIKIKIKYLMTLKIKFMCALYDKKGG